MFKAIFSADVENCVRACILERANRVLGRGKRGTGGGGVVGGGDMGGICFITTLNHFLKPSLGYVF